MSTTLPHRHEGTQVSRILAATLLLAGGWPRSPALFTVAAASESTANAAVAGDGFLMSEDELYGPLVSAANLIGYALYPVDLPGAGARSR